MRVRRGCAYTEGLAKPCAVPEFLIAVLFLLTTPGPGVLSTAGVGAAFGYRAGLSYVGGLFVGSNLTLCLVISGIAAVILAVPCCCSFLSGILSFWHGG